MYLTNSALCASMSTHLIYHVVEGAQGRRNAMAFFILKNRTNDKLHSRYQDPAFRLSRTQGKRKSADKISPEQKKLRQNLYHYAYTANRVCRWLCFLQASTIPTQQDHRDLPFL